MNFEQLVAQYAGASLETWNTQTIRHNVYSEAGQHALELYEHAVRLMKQRSEKNPGDPLGWYYQAGIHGIFFGDGERTELATWAKENGFASEIADVLSGNTVLNNCTHFGRLWWTATGENSPALIPKGTEPGTNFLGWHRLYLQSFEDVIRTVLVSEEVEGAETWALPYWKYTDENEDAIPSLFRTEASSLYEPSRSVLINEGTRLTNILDKSSDRSILEEIKTGRDSAMGAGIYKSMNSLVERSPHNTMHMVLGGEYDMENKGLATAQGQQLIEGGNAKRAQVEWAKKLGIPNPNEKAGPYGLMANVGAAALDPVFWIHHAYIDKLFSDWNFSENASFLSPGELSNNPWNYQFFVPSTDGTESPKTYSYWGNNPDRVLSGMYNVNYGYDELDNLTPRGPNPALSLLELPAYRPIAKVVSLGGARLPKLPPEQTYSVVLDPGLPLSLKKALGLNREESNLISLLTNIKYRSEMSSSETITFVVGAKDQLRTVTSISDVEYLPAFNINPFPMAGSDPAMLMNMHISIDLAALNEARNAKSAKKRSDYFARYGDEDVGFLLYSTDDNIILDELSIAINQDLGKSANTGSSFDAAAYFAQKPELLTNANALKNPEIFFVENRLSHEIAPKLNFRAAAIGMRHLMTNPQLVAAGISASPYEAIARFLDEGQRVGDPLGDIQESTAKSWLNWQESSDGPVLDLSTLKTGDTIRADVVIGRDAFYNPVVGFYRVLDLAGTVQSADGSRLAPGDHGYADAALTVTNQFDELTGLNANAGIAEKKSIRFDSESGLLAPFAQVNGNLFFGFSKANDDGISHFIAHGVNLIGLEDLQGGDNDYDDTLIGFSFSEIQTVA